MEFDPKNDQFRSPSTPRASIDAPAGLVVHSYPKGIYKVVSPTVIGDFIPDLDFPAGYRLVAISEKTVPVELVTEGPRDPDQPWKQPPTSKRTELGKVPVYIFVLEVDDAIAGLTQERDRLQKEVSTLLDAAQRQRQSYDAIREDHDREKNDAARARQRQTELDEQRRKAEELRRDGELQLATERKRVKALRDALGHIAADKILAEFEPKKKEG